MAAIVPAILAKDAIEFAQRLRMVEGAVDTVQVDCMDGTFVPEKTFFDAKAVATMATPTKYDLHLMVNDPRTAIAAWKKVPTLVRATFHAELNEDLVELARWIASVGIEAQVSINPETPLEKITDLLPHVKGVLIMGVHPGKSGQKMLPETAGRVAELRALAPTMRISVDGGVTLLNAPALIKAGADELIVNSVVFRSKTPKKVIHELKLLKV